MAQVTQEKINFVVEALWQKVYKEPFRGKKRGRFAITRTQLRDALGTKNLQEKTIQWFQNTALDNGLVVINLDDLFPCVEVEVLRKYRRPPKILFQGLLGIEIEVEEIETEDVDDAE